MDYNSLNARFQQIKQTENETLQKVDEIIDATNGLSKESTRVAEVAHNSEKIMQEIERDFESSTKITNPTDMSFLGVAIALQCLRWFLLNKLTERTPEGNNKFEDWAHKAQEKVFGEQPHIPDPSTSNPNFFNYYVPFSEIVGTFTVPYDAIAGTKDFNVGGNGGGLSARSHRYRTLGHDPLLGFVFGTANILSSTLTNWQFRTFFVNSSNAVVANASTVQMFAKVTDRAIREPKALGAAVIKQGLHIVSDVYTTSGIPIPIVQTLSPQLAQQLGQFGIDTGGLLKAAGSAKLAALIDSLIATVHGLYYDETVCSLRQYEVRTRKILSISKVIAEGSNILATVCTRDITNLDLGGLIYTFHRLLTDIDFISEVKKEYMSSSFKKIIMGTT
jgi:ferritin-like metal-binding protein YciE